MLEQICVHYVGFGFIIAEMEYNISKYVFISVLLPVAVHYWVFISIEWALYVNIERGGPLL